MKLKLFSFMKSGKPVKASEESENTDAPEVTDGAEDSEESEEDADADAGSDEEEAEEETESSADQSARITALAKGYNAMGAHVEKLTSKLATAEAEIANLKGDKSAEVDVAAGKKAQTITASQGVPEKAVAGVSDVGASDAPTSNDEFISQYSEITDPVKAGAFYAKYTGKFN